MSKTAEIYTGATSLSEFERARIREKMGLPAKVVLNKAEESKGASTGNPSSEISPEQSSQFAAEKFNWMESPVTGELLKSLTQQVNEAEENARKLAYTFGAHQDIFQIVRLLNKSTELRKIIDKYGRNKSNTH